LLEKKTSSTVGSVTRALNLVDYVMTGPSEGLTLTEIAREMKSSKSAALATLRTLVEHGYLRMSEPGPRYLPGMSLIRLGDLASARDPIASVSRPIMNDLNKKTGLTVRIARNDDGYPVFVDRVDGPGVVRFFTPLGVREYPHVSSVGKAILAELPDERIREIAEECGLAARTPKTITSLTKLMADIRQIRKRGYGIDDEEDAQGVVCIGAAFYDHFGNCAGGISATGLKSELSPEKIEKMGLKILKHAEAITQKLGGKVKVRGQ